jgi:hypothetical protein
MNNDTTYNGWTNRQTWLVGLWLCNDQANYQLLSNVLRLHVPVIGVSTGIAALLIVQAL